MPESKFAQSATRKALVRSWPRRIPEGRSHVVDGIERLVIENCHYGSLGDIADDVLLVEWDIAVDKLELLAFAERARATPDAVLVAPYRIYYEHLLPAPIWAHRHWAGEPLDSIAVEGATPVETGDPFCQLFGLGMVYLPRDLIRAFLSARYAAHFGDVEFSQWHYRNVTPDVPIDWSVHPVHLNYQTPEV